MLGDIQGLNEGLDASFLHSLDSWLPQRKYGMALAFYFIAFLCDFVCFYVWTPIEFPHGPKLGEDREDGQFGWHFIHLTFCGGTLQILYFLVCIIDSFASQKSGYSDLGALHRFRDGFFTLAFACGSGICIGYW